MEDQQYDVVSRPRHYASHPRFTCECIEIARLLSFDAGNALKYMWRFEQKNGGEDIKKSLWYLGDLDYAKFNIVWLSDDARAVGVALAEQHVFPFLNLDDRIDSAIGDLLTRP